MTEANSTAGTPAQNGLTLPAAGGVNPGLSGGITLPPRPIPAPLRVTPLAEEQPTRADPLGGLSAPPAKLTPLTYPLLEREGDPAEHNDVVILPCHNVAEDLEHTLRRIELVLSAHHSPIDMPSLRLHWIDDGSSDGTRGILERWLRSEPHPLLRGCRWPASLVRQVHPHGLTVTLLHAFGYICGTHPDRLRRVARMDTDGDDDHTLVLPLLLSHPLEEGSVIVIEREILDEDGSTEDSPAVRSPDKVETVVARHLFNRRIEDRRPDLTIRPWKIAGLAWSPRALRESLQRINALDFPYAWGLEWELLLAHITHGGRVQHVTVPAPVRRRARPPANPNQRADQMRAWSWSLDRWLQS